MKCPYCEGTGELDASIGALIAARRNQLGLTQLDVAEKVGCTRAHIANLETDRTDLPIKTLLRVAMALDCSAKDLLP